MNFKDAVKSFFTNYANFKGRARRSEYWWVALFIFITTLATSIIDDIFVGSTLRNYGEGPISGLFSLAILIPSLAVGIRRLHDIGKSGWNILFGLIPFAGFIILIVWFCKESSHPNQWGLPANNVGPSQPYQHYPPQSPYGASQQPYNGYAQPNPYQAPQQPFNTPQQPAAPYGANPLPPRPQDFQQQNPYGAPPQDLRGFWTEPNPYIEDNDPNRNPYKS